MTIARCIRIVCLKGWAGKCRNRADEAGYDK